MKFSIIVPVYNVEKYIEECIESLISQKDIEYEILLVNDGSKDRSGIICADYADKYENIKVLHKDNGGLSDARNAGINIAKGEYILFVDGDDVIEHNSLANIQKTIEDNCYPDIVCLELKKFFTGREGTIPMNDGITSEINKLRGSELYRYLSNLPKYPASACTKAIKRELFISNNLLFEKGLLSEDLEWCIRLLLAGKTIAYCPANYYYYRQAREESISSVSSSKKTIDILNTYIKWTTYASNLQEIEVKQMICSYMEYIFRFLLIGYFDIERKSRQEYMKEVRKGTWILGARKDVISVIISCVYKIFGISIAGYLLRLYLKVRKE